MGVVCDPRCGRESVLEWRGVLWSREWRTSSCVNSSNGDGHRQVEVGEVVGGKVVLFLISAHHCSHYKFSSYVVSLIFVDSTTTFM